MPGVGDEEVPGRIERDAAGRVQEPGAEHGVHARRRSAAAARPCAGPAPPRWRARRARQRRQGHEVRRTAHIMPVAAAAGSDGDAIVGGAADRPPTHGPTRERRRPPCPHPKRPSAPGTSRSPAPTGRRSTPTRPCPPATGPSPGSWSSTTCRAGTRAPRRSRGASPPKGYNAICPNLYARQGLDVDPDDAAAATREAGGIPDEQFVGDAGAAVEALRALPTSNGKVGVIGYCSGGRHSFLTAVSLPVDAAVDCYGAFVTGTVPDGFPLKVTPLVDRTPELACPLLGLFGNDDQFPSPEQVDELEAALKAAGKTYEFHRYDGAGHAFFSVDRPAYRPEAAVDGWQRIFEWYGRYLAGG